MHRIHITTIALLAGIAVALGTFTVGRSGSAASPAAPAAQLAMSRDDLAAENARLDAAEADLARQLAAAPKPRRVAPVVRYVQSPPAAAPARHHDDDEYENEDEGGDDD